MFHKHLIFSIIFFLVGAGPLPPKDTVKATGDNSTASPSSTETLQLHHVDQDAPVAAPSPQLAKRHPPSDGSNVGSSKLSKSLDKVTHASYNCACCEQPTRTAKTGNKGAVKNKWCTSCTEGLSEKQLKGKTEFPDCCYKHPRIDCKACGATPRKKDSIQPQCGHEFCSPCVGRLAMEAANDESKWPLKCCGQEVPASHIMPLLGEADKKKFKDAEFDYAIPKDMRCRCVACDDELPESKKMTLPCHHNWCQPCVGELVRHAIPNESGWPPHCCRGYGLGHEQAKQHLTPAERKEYDQKNREYAIPHSQRYYCPKPGCGKWSEPTSNPAVCPTCHHRACRYCKQAPHPEGTICAEDTEMQSAIAAARESGMQECSKCKNWIVKAGGCNHMTCRCKAEWCWACRRPWGRCDNFHCPFTGRGA